MSVDALSKNVNLETKKDYYVKFQKMLIENKVIRDFSCDRAVAT